MHNSFFVSILVTRLFTALLYFRQCTFRSVPHTYCRNFSFLVIKVAMVNSVFVMPFLIRHVYHIVFELAIFLRSHI